MTCQEFASFLMAYVDGELGAKERARFDEHMAICPACVRYLQQYQDTIQAVKLAIVDDLPADVPEELVRAVVAAKRTW